MPACRAMFPMLLILAAQFAGCDGRGQDAQSKVQLPDWLHDGEAPSKYDSQSPFSEEIGSKLGLNLKVGDQFPLRKIVEQELKQDSISGANDVNHSRLELLFAISVIEQQPQRTKLGVRYSRVKYKHTLGDETLEFDSANPGAEIPLAVRAYHDMVGDGFAFWIGADNQIIEEEGLAAFIDRCMRNVPEAYRQEIVLGIEAGSGETGIANFVDNSIGLLPFGARTNPGDSWQRRQSVPRPVPMHVNTTYTLKQLSDEFAVIDIRGTIAPSSTINILDDGAGIQVRIDGGSTLGSCTVFRDTGLPKESKVDRTVDMTVTMANAITFKQKKRITTTIESYPAASSTPPLTIGSNEAPPEPRNGAVRPVAGSFFQEDGQ